MMKRNKPLTGSVQSNGTWYYAVINTYVRGKRKQVAVNTGIRTTGSKREAEKFLREELARREKEAQKPSKLKDASADMSFVDYLRMWVTTKKRKIEENTYNSYEAAIEGHINSYFSGIHALLSSLEPGDFDEFYEYLYDKGLSGTTALYHHRLMKQALNYAVNRDILVYNVMVKVDAPEKSDFVATAYSADELKQLLEAAKDDTIYPPIVLSATMGLRRSEALGVRWRSVDLDAGRIIIEHKVLEFKTDGGPLLKGYDNLKTKAARRSMPIPARALEALKEAKEKQAANRKAFRNAYSKDRNGYVCVDAQGNPLRPNYVTGHFVVLLKSHGLRRIRFHELRHTAASLLAMNGLPIKNIQLYLGHSNYSTTADIYTHLDASAQAQSVEKMNEILG